MAVYHMMAVIVYNGNLPIEEFEDQLRYMLDCMDGVTKRAVQVEVADETRIQTNLGIDRRHT